MYTAHWRVARIEPGRSRQTAEGEYVEDHAAVVFERIDPLNEAAPPVERRVVASRGG